MTILLYPLTAAMIVFVVGSIGEFMEKIDE